MTYHTNIKHQETVALLGSRNLQLRLVYAHIANYTQVKGAWCGKRKKLADELEMERSVVSRKLDELITMGVITEDGDNYRAVCTQECAESTEKRAENTQKCADSTSPAPPINKINNMENNELNARANMRDANPSTQCSFERLLSLYKKRAGDYKMADEVLRLSRNLWDEYPLWKRFRLFEELNKHTGWFRPRLDWTLQNFNPQPTDLTGTAEGGEMLNSGQAKIARYNGSYGVYSLKDIADFDLPEPPKDKKKSV